MPIPTSKIELLAAINSTYGKLRQDLDGIPIEITTLMDLEGHAQGTKMSVNNLLAYLIGWGQLVLKWNAKMEKGETVVFPEEGYQWNQLGLLAQQFYSNYKDDDYKVLLEKLDKTV